MDTSVEPAVEPAAPAARPKVTRPKWKSSYGPQQLRDLLGLAEWQMERLAGDPRFPGPDLNGRRWSMEVARQLYRRRASLAKRAGSVPDLGAWRVAELLSERFGVEVVGDTVVELARAGRIVTNGWYKGNRLYSGRSVERFTDRKALDVAAVAGRMVRDEAAVDILGCRMVDLQYLIDKGYLRARQHYTGQWGSKVPLYRTGDLHDLLADDRFDWPAVQAAGRGTRSLLSKLPPAADSKPVGGRRRRAGRAGSATGGR